MKCKITVIDGVGFAKQQKKFDGSMGDFYGWFNAECIKYEMDDQGVERKEVGVMRIPGALCPIAVDEKTGSLPGVPAGDYLVEFKIKRDYKTREFQSSIASFEAMIARPQSPKDLAQPKG